MAIAADMKTINEQQVLAQIEQFTGFRTSDGKTFEDQADAVAHQWNLNLRGKISNFVEDVLNRDEHYCTGEITDFIIKNKEALKALLD